MLSDTRKVNFLQQIWEKIRLKKIPTFTVILLSFGLPIAVLFFLDPDSFQLLWKGRTFYLFFLWLVILEVILDWDDFKSKTLDALRFERMLVFFVALLLPTVYVVFANYFGLNEAISALATQLNIQWIEWVPLSIEYLVLTVLFVVVITIAYGVDGLRDFSISAFLIGAVGTVYMIDNLYPYGTFAPLQAFVPTTAVLASDFLNFLGYQTLFLSSGGGMPTLWVSSSQGSKIFQIAWPCSGVQSLLLYTFTILFFLKKTNIPWMQRIVYFAIGALVTYFINIVRIASIYIIAINGGDWMLFHNYYGELYSMTWIIAYPLIIIGSRMLWIKVKLRLNNRDLTSKPFTPPPSI